MEQANRISSSFAPLIMFHDASQPLIQLLGNDWQQLSQNLDTIRKLTITPDEQVALNSQLTQLDQVKSGQLLDCEQKSQSSLASETTIAQLTDTVQQLSESTRQRSEAGQQLHQVRQQQGTENSTLALRIEELESSCPSQCRSSASQA